MMDSGDTARVSLATDPGIDFTTTGAMSVWDFSNLIPESQRLEEAFDISTAGQIVSFQFGSLAPPRYNSNYYQPFDGLPFDQVGQFLPVNIEDINRIVKIDNDSMTYPGYSITADGQQLGFRSDTIEKAYEFPMNFQDSLYSRGYTYIDFNPIFNGIFIQYRQRESVVDGYGTLITPYSYFNVIRVHHRIAEQDSFYTEIFGAGMWIPINRTTHTYEWWAKNQKRPVMRINTEEVGGNEVVSEISYTDEYLGLDAGLNEEEMITVRLFPNPAHDKIVISASYPIRNVVIRSLSGQEVMHQKDINSNETILNLKGLSAGTYLVITESQEGKNTSKLVIE